MTTLNQSNNRQHRTAHEYMLDCHKIQWSWDCCLHCISSNNGQIQTHTHTALCPGQSGSAGTRKVKPIWILLKQETLSGSGISWAICKSAPRSRQITTPTPQQLSFFYRPDALPAAQPKVSKHWRQVVKFKVFIKTNNINICARYSNTVWCLYAAYVDKHNKEFLVKL